ncbi:WLM-domain-containing protein [Cristinia sonorae]|uniref:WLM-domain-containing protein n=1 Tax=Cristinia sonorae TaxID=1940300 RepID=A0A8K0UIW9_9AGAR|nr:WLM-domain-containing protein [Cristinia sonorae]
MVHSRINERETNPNPHVNFITPLPRPDQEDARQLLRALAAQVRPVMKAHGFVINSFEEYEYNRVFAGRNWNNGECVEIVLRGPTGAYYSSSWLLGTLCHELAHIKHMNHGPAFQALWSQLREEVRQLQSKGYYGDGYWSSGQRLADSVIVGGSNGASGALPEYMCGGAQTRERPTYRKRRLSNPGNKPARAVRKPKPGSRVTAKGTFKGEGHALNEGMGGEDKLKGVGFKKKAASNRAREERALAAEKRLRALTREVAVSSNAISHESDDESDSQTDGEEETDKDRRRAMLDTMSQSDLDTVKTSRSDTFIDDFFFPLSQIAGTSRLGNDGATDAADVKPRAEIKAVTPSGSSSTLSSSSKGKRPLRQSSIQLGDDIEQEESSGASSKPVPLPRKRQKISYGSIVADEVRFRKKESLGLTDPGRQLGDSRNSSLSGEKSNHPRDRGATSDGRRGQESEIVDLTEERHDEGGDGSSWTCGVCTLMNQPLHLACDACGIPRGEVFSR